MKLNEKLSALSDPTRRKILDLLKGRDMNAGDIGKKFKMTAPSLSHLLGVLKRADLVTSLRSGKEIIYSLNLSVFEEVAEKLMSFFKK
jgi:DNA-binding transcriptional ArsR family regulator